MKSETTLSESKPSLGLANENDSKQSGNKQMIEYHPVAGTPFTVAREGERWFVLMGKYRFTEDLKSRGEATKHAKTKSWTTIMQVIQVMITDNEQQKENAIAEKLQKIADERKQDTEKFEGK